MTICGKLCADVSLTRELRVTDCDIMHCAHFDGVVVSSLELLRRVGSEKSQGNVQGSVILLLVDDRYEGLERVLRARGYTVVMPSTPDQGVALCLHNHMAAAIVDQTTLADDKDWSLAQSLKAVSPNTPVLLLVPDRGHHIEAPRGVDCVVSEEPRFVLDAIRNCLARAG